MSFWITAQVSQSLPHLSVSTGELYYRSVFHKSLNEEATSLFILRKAKREGRNVNWKLLARMIAPFVLLVGAKAIWVCWNALTW